LVLSAWAAPLIIGASGAWSKPVPRLLMLGDSITAGYGLPSTQSLPVRLQAALEQAGYEVEVINGGVSGDTSAGGLARVDWMLADRPDRVIVELGANDGLRGVDPKEAYDNLDRILSKLDAAKIPVLLAGMLAPPNLGPDYGREFAAMYPKLAAKHHCLLYPFLLDGVAAKPELNQADGLHPNAQGVRVMVGRLLPYVERLLAAP
jgi:acyl-CoA thioesterase I